MSAEARHADARAVRRPQAASDRRPTSALPVEGWSVGDRACANDQAAGDLVAAGVADEEDELDSFFAPGPASEAPLELAVELSTFGSDALEPLTVARLSLR